LIHSPIINFDIWGNSPAHIKDYSFADIFISTSLSGKNQIQHADKNGSISRFEVIPLLQEQAETINLSEPPVPGRFVLFINNGPSDIELAMLQVAFCGLENIAHLVIIGKKAQVQSRNESILNLGPVNDIVKRWLLSKCEFVCLSKYDIENTSAPQEAMYYGKPVLTLQSLTHCNGITDDMNVFVVQPDDTDSLHMSIGRLLMDNHLRKSMSMKALELYNKHFSPKVIIQKLDEIYRTLLKKQA
jgi:glycosyltransferase involved in cell wall biosynthesis